MKSEQMVFRYLEKDNAVPFPAGSRFRDKNILVRDGNNLALKKVDTIDVQEQINSYEDGVSLSKMIERYKRTGDISLLNRSSGFYADVSGLKSDPVSVINEMRKVREKMESVQSDASDKEDPKVQVVQTAQNTIDIGDKVDA